MIGDGTTDQFQWMVSEQDGYFTTAQAADSGYSALAIATRLDDGIWNRVESDLLRIGGWPRSELEEYAKWCAWLGTSAVISHQSAAELHGMANLHPRFVHVRVSGTSRAHDQRLAVHRGRLDGRDIEYTGSFRITTPIRTTLDLAAGGISQFTLDEVVGDGLVLGRLQADELVARALEFGERVAERIELALSSR
ncbi:type IV toxin-antitoxin system AbiEi family antitoxin domain-containing protein [Actinomycetes bacterium M1A6_2h]